AHSIADLVQAVSEEPLGGRDVAPQLILVLRDLRQMLVHDVLRGAPNEEVESKEHDREVVELSQDRDEVGDEIEGQDQIRTDPREDQLLLPGDARVAQQGPDQPDVGRAAKDQAYAFRDVVRRHTAYSRHRRLTSG